MFESLVKIAAGLGAGRNYQYLAKSIDQRLIAAYESG